MTNRITKPELLNEYAVLRLPTQKRITRMDENRKSHTRLTQSSSWIMRKINTNDSDVIALLNPNATCAISKWQRRGRLAESECYLCYLKLFIRMLRNHLKDRRPTHPGPAAPSPPYTATISHALTRTVPISQLTINGRTVLKRFFRFRFGRRNWLGGGAPKRSETEKNKDRTPFCWRSASGCTLRAVSCLVAMLFLFNQYFFM